MLNIENWNIINIIKDKSCNKLLEVTPVINYLSEDEELITELEKNKFDVLSEKKWVVKYMKNFKEEVELIEQYKLYENKLFIPMPNIEKFRLKFLDNDSWYVMEKCDGSINEFFHISKNLIENLMTYMIDVFCWLHLDLKKIHGDIKVDNILIKIETNKTNFYLIDYENMKNVKTNISTSICQKNLPNGYYYYYLGCEKDKPYLSYRMDLEAFGIILIQLCLSDLNFFSFEWQFKAKILYGKRDKKNHFQYLDEIKNVEIKNEMDRIKNNFVIKYLEIIKQQDWEATEPNINVYNELKNLFNK